MMRYELRDASGAVEAVHVRSDGPDGKRMHWERPDGSSGLNGTKTADLPVYGAHLATTWDRSRVVVLTEGEKACDKLIEAGYQAAGTVTGAASTPSPAVLEILRGHRVVLWPDADDAGRKHMARIAERLGPIAATVALVTWPAAPLGGDAADVVEADTIEALIDGAEPLLSPEARLRAVIDQQVPDFRERLSRALQIVDKQPASNGGPAALRFYTPAELAALTLPTPDWLIPGFLAVSAITEIDGKIKKAGKTTLSLYMVKALLTGSTFLGWPTRQARVVYVSEQQRQTFTDALRRTGLAEYGDELHVLLREELRGMKWPEVVRLVQEEAVAGNRDLVVIDTIGKLAGIVNENDAGEWSRAMEPLQDLAASGRAVLIDRHDRKSGGEVGESGRGSSQASGDVDIILQLRRPEGNQPTTRRVLESASRYPDTPEKILIELTDEGYVNLGSQEGVATEDAKQMILVALGDLSTTGNESGVARDRLVELGKEHEPKVSEWAIRQALDILVAEGRLERLGEGKKGSPYTFHRREEFLSGVTQNLGPQEANESEDDLLGQFRMEEPE